MLWDSLFNLSVIQNNNNKKKKKKKQSKKKWQNERENGKINKNTQTFTTWQFSLQM